MSNKTISMLVLLGLLSIGLSRADAADETSVKAALADEIWTPGPLAVFYDGLDYFSERHLPTFTNSEVCCLNLAGTRNGAFSAQVAVYMAKEGKGPEVRISELKLKSGSPVIPVSSMEIFYALPTGRKEGRGKNGKYDIFDALDTKPRDTGRLHPVWLTVNVPSNAVAGEYEGKMTVAGRDIPVKLSVADWTLPQPINFETWADFIQSPESVAMRYGVELWSDKHWDLIGKSFEQLAKVGNKTMYLELIGRTNLGNEQSMVRWIKTGEKKKEKAPPVAAGKYKEYMDKIGKTFAETEPVFSHDFSIVEKYMDLYIQKVGIPKVVVLYFYEATLCGGWGHTAEEIMRGAPVTVYDPEKKTVSTFEGPSHNVSNIPYPGYPDESASFWKPVIDGLRERINKRGMKDEAIMLGLTGDYIPAKGDVAWWVKTFPYARFAKEGHGIAGNQNGIEVGYCTTVWNAGFPSSKQLKQCGDDMGKVRMHGWRNKAQVCCFARNIDRSSHQTQLLHSRLLGEMNIAGNQRGFGRMSADFWECLKDEKGQFTRSISARYPQSNWMQLNLRMLPYLYCGTNGATSTVRFEMMREGLQECEAVIRIDKALVDKTLRVRLGEEFALKCQNLLDERTRALMTFGDEYSNGEKSFPDSGWQARSAELFKTAGEVARLVANP